MTIIDECELGKKLEAELLSCGADIVGFGDLSELPEDVRDGLPVGVSVAAAYPGAVIAGISELPTPEYLKWYDGLNDRLDRIVTKGAEMLRAMGYKALAQSRENVRNGSAPFSTALPHKTVATRSGIGWIGKCALLVTERYGSAVRLSSILTDAPLLTGLSSDQSRCGDCMICTKACPGGAVSGKLWQPGLLRDDFFNAAKCRETALKRSKKGLDSDIALCGKCIEVCPYTKGYLRDCAG